MKDKTEKSTVGRETTESRENRGLWYKNNGHCNNVIEWPTLVETSLNDDDVDIFMNNAEVVPYADDSNIIIIIMHFKSGRNAGISVIQIRRNSFY
jgi:hypothetical protein